MARRITRRGHEIRNFILYNVDDHPQDIGKITQDKFGIARQTASKYLNGLIAGGLIRAEGNTRARRYHLSWLTEETFEEKVHGGLQEDLEWRNKIRPHLEGHVATNVLDICQHGFTEMVNNVIDHSDSDNVLMSVSRSAVIIQLMVRDYGIGIFQKIQQDFQLNDPRHALLELSKGKLTSDNSKHSGEGIFFTSRMFDWFSIRSRQLFFSRRNTGGDWFIESDSVEGEALTGTCIIMEIPTHSERTIREVFDRYASEFYDYGFTKTHVPIKLGTYDDDQLVSRSAAKRVLARVNAFKEVMLDFQGVTSIGQAFADEIFRVFKNAHPEIDLIWINENPDVERMIQRALTADYEKSPQLSLV